ncbi:tyrosine-protein phosphatase non-receptor type 61F isoform X2 [Cylas formicarius]|uniref:tyrosine-protein phosphatase non-receptor type 61F isoform X2 n=1 Tax=Cylas formicarius TaxID=197179 RepID=UPI002958BEF4|nr:tyrosine-protein phosphatase non-receptor type 61F isoform X2 [Cylas formicarius]
MTAAANNIETEYLELNSKDDWPAFYQKIRAKSLKQGGTCMEALKPQNKVLNRYRDVHPYDHSRIVLQRGSTDYINANLCRVEKANRKYILTQGPLANTVSHFWLMIWEQNSKAVLMLNKLIEKKAEKCYQYWPAKVGATMSFDDVGLTLEYLEQQDHSYYLTRVLRLTDTESDKSRDILQFHYITWPDFGVPCSPTKFLDFLKRVRTAGVLEENVGPAVIHCSAGIGRSGTFCLVDSCLVLIEKYGLNSVNVEDVLLEMRKYRIGLIQTHEQLRFSYQAIIEGVKQLLNPSNTEEGTESNHADASYKSGSPGGDIVEEAVTSEEEEDDEPPPLPPPRIDSLSCQNGVSSSTPYANRPLPTIPTSVSDDDLTYKENGDEKHVPSGPLPVVPADGEGSSEDDLEEESDEDDDGDEDADDEERVKSDSPASDQSASAADLRHRKRVERKQHMEAQVRDMKRRQQANEQWTQLKRPKTTLQD